MVWFSKHFLWIPANDQIYGNSIELDIHDGGIIELIMDDCKGVTRLDCTCDHCGYADDGYASRRLTIEELKALHEATGKAIEYYENFGK